MPRLSRGPQSRRARNGSSASLGRGVGRKQIRFPDLRKGRCHSDGSRYSTRIDRRFRALDSGSLVRLCRTSSRPGIEVIIAGAGGAAHLPGMLAAKTHLPVIGVPIPTENLRGLDSLLSIVQMPRGIPVATVAIGGAENAGLLAAQILAGRYPTIAARVKLFRQTQTDNVLQSPEAKGLVAGTKGPGRPES